MDKILTVPSPEEIANVLKLDVSTISTFPTVMTKLLQLCNDADSVAEDLARLVATDPGISTRILVQVNSAFHGLKRKITSISEGVRFLGMDEVKRIALATTVFEKMVKPGRKRNFDRLSFWRHCICVANISQLIAEEIGYENPEEAYMAGLLHDYGKIIFDQQARVNYGDFLRIETISSGQLIDLERDIIGMGHDDVGVYYSVKWGLPESVSFVVNYHHRTFTHLNLSREDGQLLSIVCLANFISWTQDMGSCNVRIPPVLQSEVLEYIDFYSLDFEMLFSKLDEKMEQTAAFYGFSFPAGKKFRTNLLQANLKLSCINGAYYFYEQARKERAVSLPASGVASEDAGQKINPRKIMVETLQAICDDFGFDRIFVMQAMAPSRQLKVIECFIQNKQNPASSVPEDEIKELKGISITIDEQTKGFVYSMRNNLPVLIRDNLSAERKILTQFNTREMIVVPFSNRTKVMGVLCMDCCFSQQNITPEIFMRLSMVVNELGVALNNALIHGKVKNSDLYDPDTRLLNQKGMDHILKNCFQKACAGTMEFSVVMMDLGRIQEYKEQFGEKAKETILRLLGKILQRISRPSDYIARKDENVFCAILTHTSITNASGFAKRIQREVQDLDNVISDRFPGLSFFLRAGISAYPQDGVEQMDDLVGMTQHGLELAAAMPGSQIVIITDVMEYKEMNEKRKE